MPVPETVSNYTGSVSEVTLGPQSGSGPTVTVGGAANTACAGTESERGRRPVIAMDVLDTAPDDWPDALKSCFSSVIEKPAEWARQCVEEYGADLICIKYDGSHPDRGDLSVSSAVEITKEILDSAGVPLVLWGCGNDEKDNKLLPEVSQACKGQNCLIGTVTEDNYKAVTAIALADGHNLITEAPLDINIGKQINILVSDMGFPQDRIVTYQNTGALGYGLEYTYSIQERQRLAALSGDKMLAMPVICDIGYESWRSKEAKTEDAPEWGDIADRGPMWEAATAVALIQSGADILRMRHPRAVRAVKEYINDIWS